MEKRYTLDELANKTMLDLYSRAIGQERDKQVNVWSSIHGKAETYYNQIHLESVIEIIIKHGWAKQNEVAKEFFLISSSGLDLVRKYPLKPYSDWKANKDATDLINKNWGIAGKLVYIFVTGAVTFFFTWLAVKC